MIFSEFDVAMMRRALSLATNGMGATSPNPMVGAVITHGDRIIGEGWHRRYGGPHAEVNAVRSVRPEDAPLLPESTIYVTLEPCSHYGKTPPCADLIVEKNFARVVVGAGDPNPKVAGRGIARIRAAGIEVDTGLLADECYRLNIKFMTAHTLHRPYITLKWAQSRDGFMDDDRSCGNIAHRFSNNLTGMTAHRLRALHDGIAVGAGTYLADNPSLTTRLYEGRNPRRVVFDRHGLVSPDSDWIHIADDRPLAAVLEELYRNEGITSLLVEGGAGLLNSFIECGLWDEVRVEVAPEILGSQGRVTAPVIDAVPGRMENVGYSRLIFYHNAKNGAKG